jgi:hypothetical protein
MTVRIFGDFIEELPDSKEYLVIGFSPSSFPLRKRWRNNGLSADFMADYVTTFFPSKNGGSALSSRVSEIKSAVNYIANELLENAMKYSENSSGVGISIQLQLYPDKLVFLSTNSIASSKAEYFQTIIQDLLSHDPTDLYLKQIEANTLDESRSGLGLLTMMNDYLTPIGWKFETHKDNPEITDITTMVQFFIPSATEQN